jgi:hypothetical protein
VGSTSDKYTVKASNFGPHRNFGLFLASSIASLDESCNKNEHNRICRSELFSTTFVLFIFSVGRISMTASPSEKEVQSFHEVQS